MVLASCSTPRLENVAEKEVFGSSMSDSEYTDILEKYTKEARGYSGLHNVFHFKVIHLTDEVIRAVARRKALYYQWTERQLREYLESEIQSTASRTKLFLSFYTPNRKHDDLNASNSMWKLYLKNENRRLTGKARKLADPVAKIAAIFPFHDNWSSPYEVEFPVSSSEINLGDAMFTVTGSLGAAEVSLNK
jgi:hypothetical protein